MKRILALALLAVLAPAFALAMNSQDVIRLTRAGAGDEVILSQIESSGDVFKLTVQDILDLKEAGVSDRVITFMINTGKQQGDGSGNTVGGIDQRRYERIPDGASDDDEAYDDSDEYGGTQRSYDNGYGDGYNVSAAFGYGSYSPYWAISMGWGFGGYYDPWYCGYWPGYWSYYSPFACYSYYWRCPPHYAGWSDWGYPYRGDYSRHNRYLKDGRDIYNRGGARSGSGGSYTSNDFGRTYKGTPVNGTTIGGRGSSGSRGGDEGGRAYKRQAPQQPGYGNRGGSRPNYGNGSGSAPVRDGGRKVKPSQPGYGTGVGPQSPPPAPPSGTQGGRTYKSPSTPPPPPANGGGHRSQFKNSAPPPSSGRGSAIGSSRGSSGRGTPQARPMSRTSKKG